MDEIEAFIKFVNKVIGLPREKYLVVINCLNNFSHALQVLNYNLDLAYSMLVYSLESLSQSFDDFEPIWEDYDPQIKNKLNSCFSKIDPSLSSEIRKILLGSSNLRLQQRFINFITRGNHHIYHHPETKRRVVVPLHKRDLPKGTLLEILKQAGISKEELRDLL